MIKEVLLSCFGMKRGPGWGVVACNVGTQCQNLTWISAKTTGPIDPKLCGPSSYVNQT